MPPVLPPGLAPGGLFSIFGAGLAGSAAKTTLQFGSESAPLILTSPFQINGQVPADLAPGSYSVTLQSAWGSATQSVLVSQTAPGIFVVSTETGNVTGNRTVGAVINQNGTLNDVGTPANRGDVLTVYCTNLGSVQLQGNLLRNCEPRNSCPELCRTSGAVRGFNTWIHWSLPSQCFDFWRNCSRIQPESRD